MVPRGGSSWFYRGHHDFIGLTMILWDHNDSIGVTMVQQGSP